MFRALDHLAPMLMSEAIPLSLLYVHMVWPHGQLYFSFYCFRLILNIRDKYSLAFGLACGVICSGGFEFEMNRFEDQAKYKKTELARHYTKINCLLECDAMHSKAIVLGNSTLKDNGINHDVTSQKTFIATGTATESPNLTPAHFHERNRMFRLQQRCTLYLIKL